jgi:hypothetical protein
MRLDHNSLLPLLPQPQTIQLGIDEELAIATSLEMETERIQEHLRRANCRSGGQPSAVFPVVFGGESLRRVTDPTTDEAEGVLRGVLARRLARAFLRHPFKIIDLEDVARVLSEGLRSRQFRSTETILEVLKGQEDTIHLGCGLPYCRRFDPALDLKRGKPKAILLFWGEALWNRPDFAIYPTDTGVIFRENNLFAEWTRTMNRRYPRIRWTQMHPPRLAINAIAKSKEMIADTRATMARIYLETRLNLKQAQTYLTALLSKHFPFTESDSGWLSEVWVEPILLPEAVVSRVISPVAIKALLCFDSDVPLVRREVSRAQVSLIPIAAQKNTSTRIQFSEVIRAYDVAAGIQGSLAKYANWLSSDITSGNGTN